MDGLLILVHQTARKGKSNISRAIILIQGVDLSTESFEATLTEVSEVAVGAAFELR